MNFSILLISGKLQNGKSQCAKLIREKLNKDYPDYKVVILPFAEKLKHIAEELFNWDGDKNIYYNEKIIMVDGAEYQTTKEIVQDEGRQLLINIGRKMREIRPTIWADCVKEKIIKDIKDGESDKKIYIIDDLRFKNELELFKIFGSKLAKMRVERNDQTKIEDDTETELDDYLAWDCLIKNNGTLEDLSKQLDPITKHLIELTERNIYEKY